MQRITFQYSGGRYFIDVQLEKPLRFDLWRKLGYGGAARCVAIGVLQNGELTLQVSPKLERIPAPLIAAVNSALKRCP